MKEKLTMISTFSGVGMQERGFYNSNLFDIDVLATSDVDKDAILSYAAIHCGLTNELIENYESYPPKEDMVNELKENNIGYDFKNNKCFDWGKLAKRKGMNIEKYWLAMKLANNLGDICKVKELPYCDLLTFSFPCQSISVAGRQEGIVKDETRSGLVYEIVRLIETAKKNNTLPKYLLLENVAALVSKKFIGDFNNLNDFFDEIGYNVYWELINGKDCGIPQNRNRCFAVYIRKDIDNGQFKFPEPFDNGIRLKDVLEDEVDEKFYISQDKVSRFITNLNTKDSLSYDACQAGGEGKSREYNDYCPTLSARDYKDPRIINDNAVKQIGNIVNTGNWDNPQRRRIYLPEGCSPALNTCGGGGLEPKILQIGKINSSQDGVVVSEEGIAPTHTAGHGNTPKVLKVGNVNPSGNGMNGNVFSEDGLAPTLTTNKGEGNKILSQFRIRKLTPKETFRLMGLEDEDCDNAAKLGVSNSALYKIAGNGIITNCCELIAEHLYKAQYNDSYRCYDENFINPQVE